MLIPYRECVKLIGSKPRGVIHIGAHLGEEGRDYAENGVKNVLWVEDNKKLMKHLFDNVKMLPLQNQFINEVLADEDGKEVTFRVTNNGQSSSILPLGTHEQHYPDITVVREETHKTRRFDSYCKEHRLDIDLELFQFVNLDVQGAELMVLKGFGDILKDFPIQAVYCEINEEEVYKGAPLSREIDDYLEQFGFRRVASKITEYRWGDALYVRQN